MVKLVDNSETSVLPIEVQAGETSVNASEPFPAGTAHSEQPVPVHQAEHDGPTFAFFAVGMVINIVLITAYFIWAFRQWKKKGAGNE